MEYDVINNSRCSKKCHSWPLKAELKCLTNFVVFLRRRAAPSALMCASLASVHVAFPSHRAVGLHTHHVLFAVLCGEASSSVTPHTKNLQCYRIPH